METITNQDLAPIQTPHEPQPADQYEQQALEDILPIDTIYPDIPEAPPQAGWETQMPLPQAGYKSEARIAVEKSNREAANPDQLTLSGIDELVAEANARQQERMDVSLDELLESASEPEAAAETTSRMGSRHPVLGKFFKRLDGGITDQDQGEQPEQASEATFVPKGINPDFLKFLNELTEEHKLREAHTLQPVTERPDGNESQQKDEFWTAERFQEAAFTAGAVVLQGLMG